MISDDFLHLFRVRQDHLSQLLGGDEVVVGFLFGFFGGLKPDPSVGGFPPSGFDVFFQVGRIEVQHLGAVRDADVVVSLLHAGR